MFSDFICKVKIIETWTKIKISVVNVLCLNRWGTPGWHHRTDWFICSVGIRARYRRYWRGGERKPRSHRHGHREEHHLQTNGQQQRGGKIWRRDQTWHTFLPCSGTCLLFFMTSFKNVNQNILINHPLFFFFTLVHVPIYDFCSKCICVSGQTHPNRRLHLVSICSSICSVFPSAPDWCVMPINRPTDSSETFP